MEIGSKLETAEKNQNKKIFLIFRASRVALHHRKCFLIGEM